MEAFKEYLNGIDHPDHRERMEEMLGWVAETFPELEPVIKWNQPMFTHHGTYIIGFSVAKNHLSVAPEEATMMKFREDIEASGLTYTKGLVRMPWKKEVDYGLLRKFIEFNIEDKADCQTFWRQ
ncbi:iron chaperone [Bhargavaea cecembensis]|uniref:Iron chaperone n=1 Tax=Bhargavaea cecembensis TaxID=394098 RepID=A0A163ESI7_9BACL|nr:iron chaperone [Bhargavaea cecembensis]KZE37096.1 iron chaperone [Bhargavaea cecembensis]